MRAVSPMSLRDVHDAIAAMRLRNDDVTPVFVQFTVENKSGGEVTYLRRVVAVSRTDVAGPAITIGAFK